MPDSASESQNPAKPPRRWQTDIVFLLVILAVAGVGIAWTKSRSADNLDYDYQNFITTTVILVGGIILSTWFIVRSSLPRHWKLLAPLVAIAVLRGSVRVENVTGDMNIDFAWRFSRRPDERLPAATPTVKVTVASVADERRSSYPRFLGSDGRATIKGLALITDWQSDPPRQVWRQSIGAGWSGFAVDGNHAVTQEQRGEDELVVCYELQTGEIIWSHADPTRFREFFGGVGPRATPTIHAGRVYSQGATGILNCLKLATGGLIWSHDIISEHKAEQIQWGRSGSPLVVEDLVVVSAGGPNGRSLVAYDRNSGELAWQAGSDRASYASPIVATLDGLRHIVTLNEDHVRGHRIADGQLLWSFPWEGNSNSDASTSQPVVLDPNRVFVSKGYRQGCAIFDVRRDERGEFATTKVWREPTLLKTKMTNVVVYDGHVYGLSGGILECVQIDGLQKKWKRGRYGHGQIMLVEDLLLVVSEQGAVALVKASPEKYVELTRFQALEGQTWNNPAIVDRYLLVRNHREAACYELPVVQADKSADGG